MDLHLLKKLSRHPEETAVYLVKKNVRLSIMPKQLSDVDKGIEENLDSLLMKYSSLFEGIPLLFKSFEILERCAPIVLDKPKIWVLLKVRVFVFRPTVGQTLTAVVSQVGQGHIAGLTHDSFNVSIPTAGTGRQWSVGDEVSYVVEDVDVRTSKRIFHLKGSLFKQGNNT